MAVDFSTRATDLNEQIVPASQIVQPVTHEGEIDALNNIARGVGVGARTIATYFSNKSTLKANKRLAKFDIDLSTLQDAEQQGISPNEIRIRGRARLQQELADNPNAEEDILRRYSSWLNNSGYDKVQTPALQQMELRNNQISTAVSNGFLSANDVNNPDKVDKAVSDLENYQQTVKQLELSIKQIDEKSGKLNLTSKEREELNAQKEQVAMNGLRKVAASSLPYWRTQYENIKTAMSKAGSEQERQQIAKNGIMQLEQDYQQQLVTITGGTIDVNDAKIQQIVKPIENLIGTYKKELSGEYDTEMFKKFSENAQAQAEMQVWDGLSTEARQMITMSNIFKDNGAALNSKLSAIAVEFFSKNDRSADGMAKPVDTMQPKEEQKDINKYFDGLKTLIETSVKGNMSDDSQVELDKQINSVMKGIVMYGDSSDDAQQFQPVVDFLSNPTVGQYLVATGAKVPPEFNAKAQTIIQNGYQQQVVPLLREELNKTFSEQNASKYGDLTFKNKSYKMSDILEPTSVNGRFAFKLKDGVEVNRTTQAILKNENNNAFTKVMNKLIMLNAHMSGTVDYQKSYDALVPQVFGGQGVDVKTAPTNQDNSQLDLESLVQTAQAEGMDTSSLEGDVADIAKAIDIGEAGGDYGTLLGFTNRAGARFDEANIQNKTIDELIQFSSSDGEYGRYTKAKLGKLATPMGRYQIVGSTLKKLKSKLGLSGDEKFTPELQDRMFLTLLNDRGYQQYKDGKISKSQLIDNLQNEWRGLADSRKAFQKLVASL